MNQRKEKDFFGRKDGSIGVGASTLVVGVLIGIWAQSHAPDNLAGALAAGWTLKPSSYYFFVAVALLLAVYGVVNIARAVIK